MVKIINSKKEFRENRSAMSGRIGFVPTMGNLHRGHLSLISQSLQDNDHTIVSIFVNPKQFAPNEDFDNYPRTLKKDIQKIESLPFKKSIIIFAPRSECEIYPPDFSSEIKIKGHLSNILCAKFRPVHFDGVATVIYQLFSLIRPTTAYFGQKDLQQCFVIQTVIRNFNFDIKFEMLPICRDENGLALSSRNSYLTNSQKQKALKLPQALKKVSEALTNRPESCHSLIEKIMNDDNNWEYLEIRDMKDLRTVTKLPEKTAIIGAYRLGKIRLLDNIIVSKNA